MTSVANKFEDTFNFSTRDTAKALADEIFVSRISEIYDYSAQ